MIHDLFASAAKRHFEQDTASGRVDCSVVVPVLNEAENVEELVHRLSAVFDTLAKSFEIIFVNGGDSDDTSAIVAALHDADPRIKLIELSRNFGHQIAMLAGLDHAVGRTVITMDGDLQHPPEVVLDLLAEWEAGCDVVHAVRQPDRSTNVLRRKVSEGSYWVMRKLCGIDLIPNSADFKLLDRRVVNAIRLMRERDRFNRGLVRWCGFRQGAITYQEQERSKGRTKYSWLKGSRLLMDGIFSLSARPLHFMGVIGLTLSAFSGLFLMYVLVGYLIGLPSMEVMPGWPSTVAVVLLMGGVQMVSLWLMGQYVGRMYEEVKWRPPYIVDRTVGQLQNRSGTTTPQPGTTRSQVELELQTV